MKKEQLPCIVDKCITFPVCRNKEKIICNKMNTYLNLLEENIPRTFQIWNHLRDTFPNLDTVVKDKEADVIRNLYGLQI